MRYDSIEEYIATLSPEEREQHRELIEECLERQRQVQESTAASHEYLRQINEDFRRMGELMQGIFEGARTLARLNQKLLEERVDNILLSDDYKIKPLD